MCGILGFSFKHGRLSAARRSLLAANLARFNDERGGDSWGVVGINADGPHISRGLGDLSDNAYELCEYQTLFAHTRAASSGEVNIKNAHPFKVGKILGAHNGAVYNHHELCEHYKRNFPVDSIHLFAHLNENRPFNELVARGAIEWIKLDDPKTIYLSKLYAGELAVYGIGTEDNVDGIVWSSNYKHLLKALYCTGLHEHFRYEVRRERVYYVNNGTFGIVKDMRLTVTEPVFNRPNQEVVHYKTAPDEEIACKTKEYQSWTMTKEAVNCQACERVIRHETNGEQEAPPSDEAGAVQFRKPKFPLADRANAAARRDVDGITLWRGVYGSRADV